MKTPVNVKKGYINRDIQTLISCSEAMVLKIYVEAAICLLIL